MRGRWVALAWSAALLLGPLGLLWAWTDPPMLPRAVEGRPSRAALALRDRVVPFQMWGTALFTEPQLGRAYGEVRYFGQRAPGEDWEAEVTRALEDLLRRHERVDLFLVSHSNRYHRWVERLDPALRARLGLVYNTGCEDLDQSGRWIELGADAYVGHPGLSASPVFYFYFLRRWTRGAPLDEAVGQSNAQMEAALGRFLPWVPRFVLAGLAGPPFEGESEAAYVARLEALRDPALIYLDSRAERAGEGGLGLGR